MTIMRDVAWHLELVTPPAAEPLELAFVRDYHLRSPNGTAEDVYLERLIRAARVMAERTTRRALIDQRWDLLIDNRFPCGEILLPRPPLIEVEAITYVDGDAVEQTLAPEAYQVTRPTGPQAGRGRIRPVFGTSWPTTRADADVVRVTYRAGYLDETVSPAEANVPEDLVQGMLLVIGEFYKQRSESVHTMGQNPAVIRARDLWLGYRVY